jgi:hypothetical protein
MAKRAKAAAAKSSATKKGASAKRVGSISHATSSKRKNIPTAEYQSAAERQEELDPRAPIAFRRSLLANGQRTRWPLSLSSTTRSNLPFSRTRKPEDGSRFIRRRTQRQERIRN